MSDRLPLEIQVEIIKKLPIKSLIRFRSVSKPWKSLIDSSEFISDYSVNHPQPQRLLVSYRVPYDFERKYVSIDDDDDTFPQRKVFLNAPKFIDDQYIIGSSHGLLCLFGYYKEEDDSSSPGSGYDDIVLWNPSIRKSVVIKKSLDFKYKLLVGFGVCPCTNDPKIVKINCFSSSDELESTSCIPEQIEVLTLSSRAWRIPFGNLPRKSIGFGHPFEGYHIALDGFIYWLALDNVDDSGVYNLIVTFDLTSEEFGEIYLPEYLAAQNPPGTLSVSKLRNSLVVLDHSKNGENVVYGVWMMEHGVPNSFAKLFTFNALNGRLNSVPGFRENGELVLEMESLYDFSKHDFFPAKLEVYEPSSKSIKDLGIHGLSFFVSSYKETLVLLDQQGKTVTVGSNLK